MVRVALRPCQWRTRFHSTERRHTPCIIFLTLPLSCSLLGSFLTISSSVAAIDDEILKSVKQVINKRAGPVYNCKGLVPWLEHEKSHISASSIDCDADKSNVLIDVLTRTIGPLHTLINPWMIFFEVVTMRACSFEVTVIKFQRLKVVLAMPSTGP